MYSNIFTIRHPGLIIFILDQSVPMLKKYGRLSRIDAAARFTNAFISDLLIHNGRFLTKGEVFVIVIEHGGLHKDNNALVKLYGWISTFASTILRIDAIREKHYDDTTNEYIYKEKSLPVWVESHANGQGNLVDAFKIAYETLVDWKKSWTKEIYKDPEFCLKQLPAPLIVNLSYGSPYGNSILNNDILNLIDFKDKIEKIEFPDGCPLICNIIIDEDNKPNIFPNQSPDKVDDILCFNMSSVIPKSLVNYYKGYATELVKKSLQEMKD